MNKNKESHGSKFILNTLTASMLLVSGQVFALEALTDADLSAVNGQDGISIQTTSTKSILIMLIGTTMQAHQQVLIKF